MEIKAIEGDQQFSVREGKGLTETQSRSAGQPTNEMDQINMLNQQMHVAMQSNAQHASTIICSSLHREPNWPHSRDRAVLTARRRDTDSRSALQRLVHTCPGLVQAPAAKANKAE
eukprot:2292040-Pleurochrysis_carterae.AAC.1